MIRKLSAHYLFPVVSAPLKFGIVVCTPAGEIIEVVDTKGIIREVASLEFYDGILVPGFIKKENETSESIFTNLKLQFKKNPELNFDKAFHKELFSGGIETGKCPGIYLITPVDFVRMRLISESRLRVLIP